MHCIITVCAFACVGYTHADVLSIMHLRLSNTHACCRIHIHVHIFIFHLFIKIYNYNIPTAVLCCVSFTIQVRIVFSLLSKLAMKSRRINNHKRE